MKDLPEEIQDVRRLRFELGDILLVTVPQHTRPEAFGQITDRIRAKIPPDVDILIMTGDIEMAVLSRGQAPPPDPAATWAAVRKHSRALGRSKP